MVLNGISSHDWLVNTGAPRDPILGVILSLLYISDLPGDVIGNISIYAVVEIIEMLFGRGIFLAFRTMSQNPRCISALFSWRYRFAESAHLKKSPGRGPRVDTPGNFDNFIFKTIYFITDCSQFLLKFCTEFLIFWRFLNDLQDKRFFNSTMSDVRPVFQPLLCWWYSQLEMWLDFWFMATV